MSAWNNSSPDFSCYAGMLGIDNIRCVVVVKEVIEGLGVDYEREKCKYRNKYEEL